MVMMVRVVGAATILGAVFVGPLPELFAQSTEASRPTVSLIRYLGTTAAQTEGRVSVWTKKLPPESGIARAWNTEVGTSTSERVAAVTLTLSGAWEVFRATVGRDDAETARGPGLVYFEVWGDGRLLARSGAMESRRHPVRIGLGAGLRVRRGFQQLEAPLRGVSQLRLVTRYTDDIDQQAPQVQQARGCLWGDAVVVAAAGVAGTGAVVRDPIRDALRLASLKLAVAASQNLQQDTGGDSTLLRLPLKTGVVPLLVASKDNVGVAEATIRATLGELLTGARVQNAPFFVPLDDRQSRLLNDVRPIADETEQVASSVRAGKRAGADVVISGTWTPGQNIRLTATLVQTGKTLGTVLVPIATP